MEFGQAQGLAVNLGFDQRINDLRYNAEANKRAAAEAEAKAKLYADDLDFKNAMNSYDNPLAKEYALGKMKELANIQKTNPNYKYDPMVQVQMKAIRNDIKDNPIVRRGMMVDSAYNEYLKDRQEALKNPQAWDMDALDAQGEQFKNYFQHGHSEGEAGFIRDGAQPVIYTRPAPFINLSNKGEDLGTHFNDLKIEYLKNGRDGGYRTIPNQSTLLAQAKQFYSENKRQFDKEYTSKGIDPIKSAAELISAGIKTDFKIGERNTLNDDLLKLKYAYDLKKAEETPGASTYDISVLNTGSTIVPTIQLDRTFGNTLPYKITNGKTTIPDDGEFFHHAGSIYDKGYREDGKYKKTGVKTIDGYIIKPMEWGKQHPEILATHWIGDPEIMGDWKNVASIVDSPPDKDGKSHKYIKIKVNADVPANDQTYRGRYDGEIMTTKQREAAGIVESSMTKTYEGHPVGSIIKTSQGDYLVSENGYIPQ